jgi:hypothetical protein
LRRGRRPQLVLVGAATIGLFFLLISPLRVSRHSGTPFLSALGSGVVHPLRTVDDLFTSGDTEIVNNIAFETTQVGSNRPIPYLHGRGIIAETLLQPIPRQIWTTKPRPVRSEIIERNWPVENGTCRGLCPTFSALGTFYGDGGKVIVAVGSWVLGYLFRGWYRFFLRRRRDVFVQAAYSVGLFLPFYIWWSGLSVLTVQFAILVMPLLFVHRASTHVQRHHGARAAIQVPSVVALETSDERFAYGGSTDELQIVEVEEIR